MSSAIYIVYLTIYRGENGLPPFYIGSTSEAKWLRGYHGSVTSRQWKALWRQALKQTPELFETIILSRHATRSEAILAERSLHLSLDVVASPIFTNMAVAGVLPRNNGVGRPMSEKTRAALRASRLGSKHTEETKQKMREAAARKKPVSDEAKANIREAAKTRKPISAESRARLSASVKAARARAKLT